MFVYLDNSATTRPYDEVIDVMSKIQRENFGKTPENPYLHL